MPSELWEIYSNKMKNQEEGIVQIQLAEDKLWFR